MNGKKDIELVISLFRHGKRNSFINMNTSEYNDTDLTEDGLEETIKKGEHFIKKYFTPMKESPFNKQDFKVYISDTIRTIKSFLYKISPLLTEKNFENKTQEELKDYTLKNFNTIYDNDLFNSYIYCDEIAAKYSYKNKEYNEFLEKIEKKLLNKSQSTLDLYKKYCNSELFKGKPYDYYKLNFISDFLMFVYPEVQKNFTKEQIYMKEVFIEENSYKQIIDITLNNPNVYIPYLYRLIEVLKSEINKVINNDKDKKKIIFLSAHDLYLGGFLIGLGLEHDKFNYEFNDEINIILFKKNEKMFVKIEYNDTQLKLPFNNGNYESEVEKLIELFDKLTNFDYDKIMKFCKLEIEDDLVDSNNFKSIH